MIRPSTSQRHGDYDERARPHIAVGAWIPARSGDINVTSPAQTYLDCAAAVSPTILLAMGDALVRRRLVTPEELRESVTLAGSRHGVDVARRIARLVNGRAESPMESALRLLLVRAGLPAPQVNAPVYDDDGGLLARADLSYPPWRVAIEYQGDHHRSDRRQWRSDLRRLRSLQTHDWLVLFATAADLERPASLLEAVEGALQRRSRTELRRFGGATGQ